MPNRWHTLYKGIGQGLSRIKKARQPYRRGTTSQEDRHRGVGGQITSLPAYYPRTYRARIAPLQGVGGMPERVEKPTRNLRKEQTPLSTKQAEIHAKWGV
jgi:hypothetical protein